MLNQISVEKNAEILVSRSSLYVYLLFNGRLAINM